MANDSTVKAGSWGARTVEKIIRIIERAYDDGVPMVYLVDSAGARITDQVDLFPGRRGAGQIFWNQVRASGSIPQVCALFGPSAAGGAYIPAFCDVVAMVDGNASMYLGSDRMVEMVTGEKTTLEAMGGAQVPLRESGRRALPVQDRGRGAGGGPPLPVVPARRTGRASRRRRGRGRRRPASTWRRWSRRASGRPSTCAGSSRACSTTDSFFEIQALWAREVTVGFGRLDGEVVGVVANNSLHKGGVLFVDSADKATRFVQLCDAFNVPLLFLADVPGFMVGTAVEKQGIIRHGAKMITAIAEATVPKICVVVRKAYGAGLYAMAGPGFEPDATIALPTAKIAVMGAEAAVNAVYANKIAAIADDARAGRVRRRPGEPSTSGTSTSSGWPANSSSTRSSSRPTCAPSWSRRFAAARGKDRHFSRRRHGVTPCDRQSRRSRQPPLSDRGDVTRRC